MPSIKADIETTLKRRANRDSQNILVDVRGDRVTVTGNVRSRFERELVMLAVWGTPGVRDVVNNISIS